MNDAIRNSSLQATINSSRVTNQTNQLIAGTNSNNRRSRRSTAGQAPRRFEVYATEPIVSSIQEDDLAAVTLQSSATANDEVATENSGDGIGAEEIPLSISLAENADELSPMHTDEVGNVVEAESNHTCDLP